MIAGLVRFAIARPLVVVAATLVLAAAGVWAFDQLRIEAYPDLTDPTVVVVTLYPGFAAEEVEQQVTVPIERALNNTPYVISRRSRTIFGLSVVELTFEDGTNDFLGRQLVLERLQGAQLPDGVTPTLGPLSGGVSFSSIGALKTDGSISGFAGKCVVNARCSNAGPCAAESGNGGDTIQKNKRSVCARTKLYCSQVPDRTENNKYRSYHHVERK